MENKVHFLSDIFNGIFVNTLKQFYSSVFGHFNKENTIQQDFKQTSASSLQNPNSGSKVSLPIQYKKNDFTLEKAETFKILFFILSFCNPISCSILPESFTSGQEPLVLRIPCDIKYVTSKKKEKPKPVGLVTRYKDMELQGGKIIFGCTCGRRNGLDGDSECRRSCCQNNPGCYMKPPQCWPQFKEPPEPKVLCIPVNVIYYDPNKGLPKCCTMM